VRAWKRAREAVFTPEAAASPVAETPYDLRHAGVTGWLNAGVPVPQVAEWAGHSQEILLRIYPKGIDGSDEMASDWPGNVRQLLQVLASARVRVQGRTIDLRDLPARHRRNQLDRLFDEVQAAERRVLIAALRETGGDRNAVARRLGISRATVYRKLKRYELN
jgi:uncharacterized membrane protein